VPEHLLLSSKKQTGFRLVNLSIFEKHLLRVAAFSASILPPASMADFIEFCLQSVLAGRVKSLAFTV
jgi:hypothetical protein